MIVNISKTYKDNYIFIFRPSIVFAKFFLDDNPICAEIGTYRGVNAFEIATHLQPSKLFLIDHYNYSNTTNKNNITSSEEDLTAARNNLKIFPQAEFIIKPSVEAAKGFEDNYFDFIYIDAEHTYESVKQDMESWFPKLKPNGLMAGHDFKIEGVMKAVKEVTSLFNPPEENTFGNYYFMGDDWWFVKNDKFRYPPIE